MVAWKERKDLHNHLTSNLKNLQLRSRGQRGKGNVFIAVKVVNLDLTSVFWVHGVICTIYVVVFPSGQNSVLSRLSLLEMQMENFSLQTATQRTASLKVTHVVSNT